jgi:hypothetical protein
MMTSLTKKILITGSREFSDVQVVLDAINNEFDEEGRLILIHGDARGADSIADDLGTRSPYITVVRVPADWENLPRWEAGPLRNRAMLDLVPAVVLAFKRTGAGNRGTQNCIDEAKKRNIPVKEFEA